VGLATPHNEVVDTGVPSIGGSVTIVVEGLPRCVVAVICHPPGASGQCQMATDNALTLVLIARGVKWSSRAI
jgi:hypothetical protein